MMRIGITGANGFIGNHLIRSAISKGYRPVALLQAGSSSDIFNDLDGKYECVWGDLTEASSLDPFLSRCDAVFNLAGFNRYWSEDRGIFSRVNHLGARNIAEGCMKHGLERLVHVSSCVTLGASDKPEARNEGSPFNLGDIDFPYARTKKAGEEEIKSWVKAKGLPAVIIHPASAIGEMDYGPTPIGKPISDIAKGLWPVYVAGGACFIDVHDVVAGLWLALERGRIGEQYLLAGDNLTNREFMGRVAECAGLAPPKVKIPKPFLSAIARAGEWAADAFTGKHPVLTVGMSSLIGKYLFFDGTKAREELGFRPGSSTAAIQRAVDWFRKVEA